MHIDDIKALSQQAHMEAQVRERLFADLQCGGRKEAVCAAWALAHLPKSDNVHIAAHQEGIVRLALTTTDSSLRRLSLALLERLDWAVNDESPDYCLRLLDFCLEHMMLPDEPHGVRSLCMKLAYSIARPYPELLGELRRDLLHLDSTTLSPGVRCTRKHILDKTK